MSRVLLNLAVFTLGVLLAFVFAVRGRLLSFANNISLGRSVEIESLTFPKTLDPGVGKLAFAKERRALMGRAVDSDDRVTILARALEDATPDSLELLRAEYLRVLPSYSGQLLPRLKKVALESLFKRFTDRDWREWPSLSQTPTAARQFVDDLTLVNSDLGNFVETAAHLLHGMYVSVASGEAYSVDDDLFYLSQNAEELLKERPATAGPADKVFDLNFASDPAVLLTFEKVKAQLTKQYARAQPKEHAAQIKLFATLDPRAVDRESAHLFADVLRDLTLRASLQFRADVFPVIVGSERLERWAKNDPVVGKALAELYLVGVLDALEVGRRSLAKRLLERSEQTYPNLPSSASVKKYFDEVTNGARRTAVSDKSKAEEKAEEKEILPASEQPKAESAVDEAKPERRATAGSSGFGFIKWLLFLALAGLGVRAFLVYLSRQQYEAYSSNLPATTDSTGAEIRKMTDPSDIQFEVDEEADIDFGFDSEVANR